MRYSWYHPTLEKQHRMTRTIHLRYFKSTSHPGSNSATSGAVNIKTHSNEFLTRIHPIWELCTWHKKPEVIGYITHRLLLYTNLHSTQHMTNVGWIYIHLSVSRNISIYLSIYLRNTLFSEKLYSATFQKSTSQPAKRSSWTRVSPILPCNETFQSPPINLLKTAVKHMNENSL